MGNDDDRGPGVPDERLEAWGDKFRFRYTDVATFLRRPSLEKPEDWAGIDIGFNTFEAMQILHGLR